MIKSTNRHKNLEKNREKFKSISNKFLKKLIWKTPHKYIAIKYNILSKDRQTMQSLS